MIKAAVSALAVVGTLVASQAAQAGPPGNPPVESPWRPGHVVAHRDGERQKTLKKDIYRTVRHEQVRLRRLFDLTDFAGYGVETVTVTLRGDVGRGRMRLLVNGRVADVAAFRDDGVLHLRLPEETVIDRELKSLRLFVDGIAFIEDIEVRLSRTVSASREDGPRSNEERSLFDQRTREGIARLILRHMEFQRF